MSVYNLLLTVEKIRERGGLDYILSGLIRT